MWHHRKAHILKLDVGSNSICLIQVPKPQPIPVFLVKEEIRCVCHQIVNEDWANNSERTLSTRNTPVNFPHMHSHATLSHSKCRCLCPGDQIFSQVIFTILGFFGSTNIGIQGLALPDRHSTTWATPPAHHFHIICNVHQWLIVTVWHQTLGQRLSMIV
jgi:hypothetical protein